MNYNQEHTQKILENIDANFDGQVDRWDRDEVNARLQEEKYLVEQQKADAAAAAD